MAIILRRSFSLLDSSATMKILLCLLLLVQCFSMPMMLVDNGKSKCVSIEAPQDTIIRISYDAPDIVTDKRDPDFGPTFITVNVRPTTRVMDTKLHTAPVKEHLKPTSQMLTSQQGYVVHKFEVDGEANICVRASTASAKNPMRFGLRVKTTDSDPSISKKGAEGPDLNTHLGHIELEMKRIEVGMKNILAEADFSKDRDWLYHQQTLAMHSSMSIWPIVQACVLIATGVAQASHIVRFFKSRRII